MEDNKLIKVTRRGGGKSRVKVGETEDIPEKSTF
jgi:hypothetical protein